MKRIILILFVLFLLIPVYSASFINKPEASVVGKETVGLKISAALTSKTVVEIGFSSNAVSYSAEGNNKPTIVNKVVLSNDGSVAGSRSNMVKSENSETAPSSGLYVYWIIAASLDKCPYVKLNIKSPMSSTATSDTLDWCVSWNGGAIASNGVVEANVFDPTTQTGNTNQFKSYVGSKELTIETVDAFWNHEPAVYNSELWVFVQARN